ncbi:MAG: RelA/SpoT domain-containing protein [Rhodospirillales bacterium]|nr:RelA/SpoT domain-containing protein [Rhodospirillales bacterium]
MGDLRRATKEFEKNPKDPQAVETLNAYRKFRLNCIRTSLSLLRESLPPKNALISARLKRLRSISRKLQRGQRGAINEMDDVIGFRVICETYTDVVGLAARIKGRLDAQEKNYLAADHYSGIGYRAVHEIVRFHQPFRKSDVRVRFEIQIRTWFQHLWACWCESYGEQAKEGFRTVEKDDVATLELIDRLRKISVEIRDWEARNPKHLQRQLPEFGDPLNVAVAWFDPHGHYQYDPFGRDVSGAMKELTRQESLPGIETLLLVGVSELGSLKQLLRQTHPRFMHSTTLDPQYWMPSEE